MPQPAVSTASERGKDAGKSRGIVRERPARLVSRPVPHSCHAFYGAFLPTLTPKISQIYHKGVGAADGHGLGINRDAPLAGSDVYSHGAWLPVGNAQVAGWFLYIQAAKLIVVALSNAGHNPGVENWFERVQQAYTEVYG